jgi:Rab9 effector protein with kelch motifs
MELYPIIDDTFKINPNIWYNLKGNGEHPMMRVGHTVNHIIDSNTNDKDDRGKLYFIGGANPSGCFNDVYIFDLNTLSWDKIEDVKNFETGRYEHASLSIDKQIYIFGGADQQETFNDILNFNTESNQCQKVIIDESNSKKSPSPRTIHNATCYKGQLIIFGGGAAGKSCIEDKQIYLYNPKNNKWISLTINSEQQPDVRHGHVMFNYNDEQIYLHGGMNGDSYYDDLWSLDLKIMKWSEVKFNKSDSSKYPCKRAAHGGVCIDNKFYIFGGLDAKNGCALDDLWMFNVGE